MPRQLPSKATETVSVLCSQVVSPILISFTLSGLVTIVTIEVSVILGREDVTHRWYNYVALLERFSCCLYTSARSSVVVILYCRCELVSSMCGQAVVEGGK